MFDIDIFPSCLLKESHKARNNIWCLLHFFHFSFFFYKYNIMLCLILTLHSALNMVLFIGPVSNKFIAAPSLITRPHRELACRIHVSLSRLCYLITNSLETSYKAWNLKLVSIKGVKLSNNDSVGLTLGPVCQGCIILRPCLHRELVRRIR